ncbi:MAG: hypothetical protein LBP21_11155 [Synergistaceae bacterium]|jgi:hypothetical protein|nr:hypothetical protein [Synergistaceae bacterium]
MKVYIDGQEYSELPGNADAASILNVVRGEMSKNGRVVTEICLDNVVMDEEAFLNVTGGFLARFTSQPVRMLIRESLGEAVNYLPKLTQGLEEIALHFEKNEIAVGEGKLADAAEGLDWLLLVFQNCSALLAVDEEMNGSGLGELKPALSESVNSLAAFHAERKYPQIALCIRQKLIPEIEKFSVFIKKLRDFGASTQ